MHTAAQPLRIGTRVRVKGPTDHPEDPVGTVVMLLNDSPHNQTQGGVVVRFPTAGTEVHARSELEEMPAT